MNPQNIHMIFFGFKYFSFCKLACSFALSFEDSTVRGSKARPQFGQAWLPALALCKLGDPGPVPSPPNSGILYLQPWLRVSVWTSCLSALEASMSRGVSALQHHSGSPVTLKGS